MSYSSIITGTLGSNAIPTLPNQQPPSTDTSVGQTSGGPNGAGTTTTGSTQTTSGPNSNNGPSGGEGGAVGSNGLSSTTHEMGEQVNSAGVNKQINSQTGQYGTSGGASGTSANNGAGTSGSSGV